jgi:uncharacterized DUF497 family protein
MKTASLDSIAPFNHIDEAGEQRRHALRAVSIEATIAAVLLVVHAYKEDRDGEQIIRIVSARRADKHELRRYQEQAVD